MDSWHVTINGVIRPAYGYFNQWQIRDIRTQNRSRIAQLPEESYKVTCGTQEDRKPGIPILCKYNGHTVTGQFHRKPDNKGIWISSNKYKSDDLHATDKWYEFLKKCFGIEKEEYHVNIPVDLEFYPNLEVTIRLRD